jgi:hypothetical protein
MPHVAGCDIWSHAGVGLRRVERRPMRIPAALALLLVALAPVPARACASCGCGDPTLTAMGTEKPSRNRLRASLELRHRVDVVGTAGLDQLRLGEQRLDGQLAWAPHERIFLLASVPLLRRDLLYDAGTREQTWGLGDLELRAKLFVYQDRLFSPRHLVALVGGAKLPTAAVDRRPNGRPLPIELQAGSGSLDAIAGASYAFFAYPWSAYAGAHVVWPGPGTSESRASRSLRGTVAGQRHLGAAVAARLALDTRLDGHAREGGGPDPNSGGFIAFVGPELLVSPVVDLSLSGWVKVSVLNRLSGQHREPFLAGLALAYDF